MLTKNYKNLATSVFTVASNYGCATMSNAEITDTLNGKHSTVYSTITSSTYAQYIMMGLTSSLNFGNPGWYGYKTDNTINTNPTSLSENTYFALANNANILDDSAITIASDNFLNTSLFSISFSDGIATVTVSNTTASDIVFNTIGAYRRLSKTASNTTADRLLFLMMFWQFDTITLAPGESISIQISHGELAT